MRVSNEVRATVHAKMGSTKKTTQVEHVVIKKAKHK